MGVKLFVAAAFENPRCFFAQRNIFLLSHMRAYTSLFGHILGSHPEIDGYYEMQMGYYSWKSLWRQKLHYFSMHRPKRSARFLFDKVLHNYFFISPEILNKKSTRLIFMLRSPESSIKSIVNLYRKVQPTHEHANPVGAAAYYIDRIQRLGLLADGIQGRYFYLDAESLVDSPASTLAGLGDWLGLGSPLSTEYQTFENTGKLGAGDSSERMGSGRIQQAKSNYADVEVPAALLSQARESHRYWRDRLRQACENAHTEF